MPESVAFAPAQIMKVELTQPLLDIPPSRSLAGEGYRRARVLVRLHTQPLGIVEVQLGATGLRADDCVHTLWRELHQAIDDHSQSDGLRPVTTSGVDDSGHLVYRSSQTGVGQV